MRVEQRKRRYIDRLVQGRLLGALIGLEVLIFAAAMVAVYLDFSQAIDDMLFRIHMPVGQAPPVLMQELLKIAPWIIGVNVVAVMIVRFFWGAYIGSIVAPLRGLFSRVMALDLRDQQGLGEHHEVLRKARGWLRVERERYRAIQAAVQALDAAADPEQTRALLRRIQSLVS